MVNFETVQSGYELICWTLRSVFWMYHEKHVWKSRPKIGSVRVVMSENENENK